MHKLYKLHQARFNVLELEQVVMLCTACEGRVVPNK